MTKKELYTCDICHTDYSNKADALKCEKEHCISTVMKDFRCQSQYPSRIEVKFTDGTTHWYRQERRVISVEHDGCKGCKYERQGQNLEPCISCEGTKKGNHYKKITYGDKIRAMSDEELVEWLYSFQNLEDKVKFCKNKDVCTDILDDGKEIPDNMCKECLVEWLQSEYERERAI